MGYALAAAGGAVVTAAVGFGLLLWWLNDMFNGWR